MQRRKSFGWDDALAVAALVATAVVIAWPVLQGGHRAYVDNPVHLAEIHALASDGSRAWSELGFMGFAVGNLHSPLWYPALAALARLTGGIERLYAALLVLGFVAPGLSVFAVARSRATTLSAFVLGYVVLIQAPMIRGISSPLAGMWTNGLGAAGVVLMAHLLARPELTRARHLAASVLLALTGLTHLFALQAAALVVIVTTLLHYRARVLSRQELVWRVVACAVAAAASASYWLTFMMTTRMELAPQGVLGMKELFLALFVPSEVLYLLEHELAAAVRPDLFLTDSIPLVGLIASGIVGFVRRFSRRDVLTETGFWLMAGVLGALAVNSVVPLPWLGPVSFRHLLWVQVGAALSAIAWLSRFEAPNLLSKRLGWLPPLLVALGLWWGKPLRNDRPAPTPDEWRDLESLWGFLREHPEHAKGRVYLQDTFGQGWRGGLTASHVLVLTQSRTGQMQLGVYYGVVPFATRWTLSEFGRLYHHHVLEPPTLEYLLNRTNTTLLVASSRDTAGWLSRSPVVERVHDIGRYSVWRPKHAPAGWVDPLEPSNDIRVLEFRPGEIRLELSSGQACVIKASWHPWWRVEGAPGAFLTATMDGLIALQGVPRGLHRVTLRYVPSVLPAIVTGIGWTVLLVWAAVVTKTLRRPPAEN